MFYAKAILRDLNATGPVQGVLAKQLTETVSS